MIEIFAYIGGIAAMLSFLPQVHMSWQTRSTSDISWLMLFITLVSAGGYEVYALGLGLVPVIIMNAVFLATVLLLMAMKWKFDRANADS